jgi:hypothetical protein
MIQRRLKCSLPCGSTSKRPIPYGGAGPNSVRSATVSRNKSCLVQQAVSIRDCGTAEATCLREGRREGSHTRRRMHPIAPCCHIRNGSHTSSRSNPATETGPAVAEVHREIKVWESSQHSGTHFDDSSSTSGPEPGLVGVSSMIFLSMARYPPVGLSAQQPHQPCPAPPVTKKTQDLKSRSFPIPGLQYIKTDV